MADKPDILHVLAEATNNQLRAADEIDRLRTLNRELLAALEEITRYRIEQLSPKCFGCNECRQTAHKRLAIQHREFCNIGKCEAAIQKAKGE